MFHCFNEVCMFYYDQKLTIANCFIEKLTMEIGLKNTVIAKKYGLTLKSFF